MIYFSRRSISKLAFAILPGAFLRGVWAKQALSVPAQQLPGGLTVMPLGDSITFGYDGTNAGYRGPLFNLLFPIAPGLRFVGSSTEGKVSTADSPLPNDQRHHEGHGSYAIADISRNLDGLDTTVFEHYGQANRDPNGGHWFTGVTYTPRGSDHPVTRPATYPDLILLMVGTNDLLASPTASAYDHAAVQGRLHELIQKIFRLRPASKVLIAEIVPSTARPNVDDFNRAVRAEVAWYRARGKQIKVVDLNTHFPISTGLSKDGVHPSDLGFAWIARQWYDAILHFYGVLHFVQK